MLWEAAISGVGVGEPLLRLNGISKLFGAQRAVDDLSLEIRRGEIFALLGPSGCGKSTTLRQIAGLDQPDSGSITLAGKTLFSASQEAFLPPQKRNMGMVFQSYAIWPHLTVFETIAYPLRLRRWPAAQINEAVRSIIRQVGLSGMEDRPSTMLSGGQQQRVALARALVYKPDVLLLDEPFSNLDVKLREQMRVEVKLLQRQVGVTVVLVTHDQAEALSLSDRIAVMNAGKVEQVGTPLELYESPATPFVRDFIGQTTKFPVTVAHANGAAEIEVVLGEGGTRLFSSNARLSDRSTGRPATACIRPESIRIGSAVVESEGNVLRGKIEALLFLGDHYECVIHVDGEPLIANAPRSEQLSEGQLVQLQMPKGALMLWPN